MTGLIFMAASIVAIAIYVKVGLWFGDWANRRAERREVENFYRAVSTCSMQARAELHARQVQRQADDRAAQLRRLAQRGGQ